jgi:hypothetical protein
MSDYAASLRTQPWVPLSERTEEELWALAAEYRQLATTAHTVDVANALCDLADRYAEMAAKHSVEGQARCIR